MIYHIAGPHGTAIIYSTEDGMNKYERRDRSTVDEKRRDDMRSGRDLVAHGRCHFCDLTVGKGPLWCSAGCAADYMAERQEIGRTK